MPELPEVEIATRNLRRWLTGRVLFGVDILEPRILGGRQSAATFRRHLVGHEVIGVSRHGKNALVELRRESAPKLWWLHLGMSGKLHASREVLPHTRVHIHADGRHVCFVAPRLLARTIAGEPQRVRSVIGLDRLGPDALSIDSGAALAARFERCKKPIKVALMEQERLAGLGNIQAAEALFRAKIHPEEPTNRLGPRRWHRLAGAISATLHHTLESTQSERVQYMSDGAHVENPFLVYGRDGEPCATCSRPIRRYVLAGRATYLCTRCQSKQ